MLFHRAPSSSRAPSLAAPYRAALPVAALSVALALFACKKHEPTPAPKDAAKTPAAVAAPETAKAAAAPKPVAAAAPASQPAGGAVPTAAANVVAAPPSSQPSAGAGGLKLQTQTSTELKVGDKTKCPIMGEEFEVESDSDFAVYKGKKVFFCCPKKCKKKFEVDPAKYLPAS